MFLTIWNDIPPRWSVFCIWDTVSWNIQHFRSWFGLTFNRTESMSVSPGQLEDPGEFEHPEHLQHPLQVVLLLLHQVRCRHQKTEQKNQFRTSVHWTFIIACTLQPVSENDIDPPEPLTCMWHCPWCRVTRSPPWCSPRSPCWPCPAPRSRGGPPTRRWCSFRCGETRACQELRPTWDKTDQSAWGWDLFGQSQAGKVQRLWFEYFMIWLTRYDKVRANWLHHIFVSNE